MARGGKWLVQVGAGWQGVVRVLWRHLASERQFVLRARLLVEGPAYRALLELHLILGQGARLVREDILDLTEVLVEVGRAPPWSGSGLGLSLGLGPGLGLGLGLELGLGSVVRVRARTRGRAKVGVSASAARTSWACRSPPSTS